MRRANGLAGATAIHPGVLRCVEPPEYWLWAGKSGDPPMVIRDPLRQFCYDASRSWCQAQRAAGRCHLNDAQFAAVLRQVNDDEEVSMPDWQVWSGVSSERTIAIERTGQIRASAAVDLALGKPGAVQLLYSASPPMIGLRVAPAGSDGALVPRRQKGGLGFTLPGAAFLRFHAVDLSATRRWPATELGGVQAIDLSAKPLTTRGRKAAS